MLGALYSPQGAHLSGYDQEPVSIQRYQEVSASSAYLTGPLLGAHREALHHAACTVKQVGGSIKYSGKHHGSPMWSGRVTIFGTRTLLASQHAHGLAKKPQQRIKHASCNDQGYEYPVALERSLHILSHLMRSCFMASSIIHASFFAINYVPVIGWQHQTWPSCLLMQRGSLTQCKLQQHKLYCLAYC